MTDRELLELAAKAANIPVEWLGLFLRKDVRREWNPLIYDGDALRLAVKLDIEFLPAYTMDGRGVIARDRNNGGRT